MAACAADGSFTEGRKLGNEFLCFFRAAVGADSVFSFGSHGLQEHKVLVAGLTAIFIKRHDYDSSQKDCDGLALAAFTRPENVEYNTHGTKTCQGKNREHGPHEARENEPVWVHEKTQERAPEHKDAREKPDKSLKIPCLCVRNVHSSSLQN
jgi:hypothetical protein